MDKNNNGINDRVEAITDYILATLVLLIGTVGFFIGLLEWSALRFCIIIAVTLSGGRTAIKEGKDGLLKLLK